MNPQIHDTTPAGLTLRQLVTRFLEAARERSESDPEQRRRAQRRHHRSWPLIVSHDASVGATDFSVALHNANDLGLAFFAAERFETGTTALVQLFWYDPASPRVPVLVRHVKRLDHGYLVGCEFLLDEEPLTTATARGTSA